MPKGESMYKSKYDAKSVFECFAGRVEYGNGGKINNKLEVWGGENGTRERHNFQYLYDAEGRLTTVYKNGSCVESYRYNDEGQRIYDAVLSISS